MASMKRWVTEAISSTGWVWGPLVAVYAPRGLSKMYFNKHLQRYARRLVPFLDPFVSIDIISNKSSTRGEESGQSSNNAYKEVGAYLTKVCMRDAHAFYAEGTVEGCSGFVLRLGVGQEVTDNFRGVTVWWLSTTTQTTDWGPEGGGRTTCFRLMFPQQHRTLILDEYLPHVRQIGREDLFVTIDIVDGKKSIHTGDFEFSEAFEAFEEVKAYLNLACSRDAHDLYADGTVRGDGFLFSLRTGEEVADSFRGVTLRWLSPKKTTNDGKSMNCFRLVFPQQHRALILDEYLPHVRRHGHNIMIGKRGQRLYSNIKSSSLWRHIDFEHPTTFETLAMHPNKKRKIMEDLDNFRRNKHYYCRIGKPWKRGYLLYGPPGTGKSTMIAAMANYLNYDIYDMELTSVSKNSDLRSLLVQIPGKSIIVFEDIDCCFDDVTSQRSNLEGRASTLSRYGSKNDDDKSKVTLSGLLNFIDGIWSAQTGERIIVFTTNFPNTLDEALIRSGRMDMQIEMSYCCFEAFQTLAKNYLGVGEHPLFQRVEELLQVVEIAPADVAECFLRSQTNIAGSGGGVETCIGHLIDELEKKAAEPKMRRRLVPFITIDIVSNKFDIVSNKSSTGGKESGQSSNNAYKEVETYLIKVCMRDAHAFCAEGTVEGLLLSLRQGQEVTDDFRGVTVWWTKGTADDGRDTSCFRLMFPQQHRALILDEYLPHVRQTGRENLFVTVDIVEPDKQHPMPINSSHLKFSHAFEEVKAYLNSACSRDAHDLYADGTVRGDSFLFTLREGEEVADSFSGVTLRWSSPKSTVYMNTKCFRLVFPQQHRALILDKYLPHVRRQGRNLMSGKRGKRLYSNRKSSGHPFGDTSSWSHIEFEHPATFDTVAMHPNKKRKIMEDLDNFRVSQDYYRRIGKPWKRGYLLYGPPGTGKSTMIAAMANYLNYDVYDMELTSVSNNSDLRSLLVKIPGKSIIVFEDIDCCFDDVTSQRSNQEGRSTLSRYCNDGDKDKDKSKVTLSGLLNFIDGVWSAQTGERIIVFTTNFPEKLDEALIRSGRMDRHIEMSFCCIEAFQTLAKNYLDVEAHPLFQRVEELLEVVEITPADVAECFLQSQSQTDFTGSDRGVETSIGCLIDELEKKSAQPQLKKQRRGGDTNSQGIAVANGGTSLGTGAEVEEAVTVQ